MRSEHSEFRFKSIDGIIGSIPCGILAGGCLSAARFDLVSTWMGDRLLDA